MSKQKPVGKLAAGPIRRWVKGKPRLAASTPALTPSGVTAPKESSNVIYNLGVVFRATIVLIVMAVIVTLASWLILVLTVLATPVISGNIWTVQRIAWVQGEAPVGSRMAILPEKVGTNIGERMVEIVTNYPDAAIVDVVAKPTQTVFTKEDGTLYVNNEKTNIEIPAGVAMTKLGNEYLTVCVSGACGKPGTAVIVPTENSIGKVIGNTDFKKDISPLVKY